MDAKWSATHLRRLSTRLRMTARSARGVAILSWSGSADPFYDAEIGAAENTFGMGAEFHSEINELGLSPDGAGCLNIVHSKGVSLVTQWCRGAASHGEDGNPGQSPFCRPFGTSDMALSATDAGPSGRSSDQRWI
jgi:hypothetical protein